MYYWSALDSLSNRDNKTYYFSWFEEKRMDLALKIILLKTPWCCVSQAITFGALCHFGVQVIVVLHPIYNSPFQWKSWMRQATKKKLVCHIPAALASLRPVQKIIILAVKEAVGGTITSVSVSMNIYFLICAFSFFCKVVSGTKLSECK